MTSKPLWEMTPEEITSNFLHAPGGVQDIASKMSSAIPMTREEWSKIQFTGDPFSARPADLGTSYEDYLDIFNKKKQAFSDQANTINTASNPPPGGPSFEELATQSLIDEANRVRSPDFWKETTDLQKQQLSKFDQDTQTLITMAQNDPSVASLLQLSKGEGPAADAAKAALRSGLDAANNMAMSQAASARGGAGSKALAMREAIAAGAQATQRAANQSQALLAQMSMQGIQGLAQQRGENMRMYGDIASKRADIYGAQAADATNRAATSSSLATNNLNSAYQIPQNASNRQVSAITGTSGQPAPVNVPTPDLSPITGAIAGGAQAAIKQSTTPTTTPTTSTTSTTSARPDISTAYSYKGPQMYKVPT